MNLGELLTLKTPIYIKSYGVGGSQIPSFRGTGASHTQLYWNGINLNSPMLGQVDLSLFPVSFSDEININYGGASLIYGTGGIGGSINMVSKANFKNPFSFLLSQTIGGFADYYIPSFKIPNYITNLSFSFGNEKLQNVFKLYNKTAKNNFLFINPYQKDNPVWENKNANNQQIGFLNETFFKLNRNNIFSLKFWWQDTDKQLPPNMGNPNSYSFQKDNSTRILGNWKMNNSNININFNIAYIKDILKFKDTKINTNSESLVNSLKSNFFIDYNLLENLIIGGGYKYNLDITNSDNFKNLKKENSKKRKQEIQDFTFRTEYKPSNFITASLLFRQQLLDKKIMPFLPSFGINTIILKKIKNYFSLKANITKNFRVPSLNDKYWYPVGNENLLPEEGWTYEVGGIWKFGNKNQNFFTGNLEATYFFSKIDNWIVWLPTTSNLWRPENLRLVHSKGIETNINVFYNLNNYSLESFTSLSFVWSKNQKPYNNLDASVGNQLVYTPIENIQSYIRLNYKKWKFTIEESYYGKRFITTSGTEYLPAYYLTNIIIAKRFNLRKNKFSTQLRLNNIFNFHYQSVARRSMPTMNFLFTLSYSI